VADPASAGQCVVHAAGRDSRWKEAANRFRYQVRRRVRSRHRQAHLAGHEQPNLLAIRLGREGDLTGTDAILWQNQRGNPYTPSPILHEGKLYMLTDSGMLSCLDAKTGTPYYAQQRLPKAYSFKASPVGANGKLYLATEDSDVVVVKMGEKFEALATNTLSGEMFISSPVIVGGDLYLRGRNTLYCIR
jgi:outer membrane protein assembly factor BamB